MSENILVVEYEPRYIERARAALSGAPFSCTFARDGEEALRAMDSGSPRLIILSSVVPKISTTELIRNVRGRKPLQETPILLTVSGYNGKTPRVDAQRVGASDILPKPYTENDLLGRVQQMLGIAAPASEPPVAPAALDETLQEQRPRRTTMAKPTDDVDKMLADTLAGMMPRKKTEATAPVPAPPPVATPPAPPVAAPEPPRAPTPAEAKQASSLGDLDKRFSDTLSGLEKSARKTTTAGTVPRPAAPAPPPAPAPAPRIDPVDRIPMAQPVFTTPEPAKVEEEEPTDGVRFGQYVLIEKIATGGMAEVWKARMRGVEGFQKTVAIKKILPHLSDNQDFIEMFIDEAKLAAQLNHNNIIHIYDLGKIQASYYIAMEYVDGYDLKNILRRATEHDQPMNVELALFVGSKIASALDYAHRKRDFEDREMGLVHRDVSPQNVLISQEGDIKLCDFGIAKAASKASHTQAGALKGKLQYMSPEQAWGRAVDRRSDIFALGTVLFEMLTGRKLFPGDSEMSILDQVREAAVQAPSQLNDEISPEIDRVVLKALHKDPDSRYQTAGELARELDAILYSFRPTPTSADLAIYMHRLSAPAPAALAMSEPAPEPEPAPAMKLRTPPVVVTPAPPVVKPAAAVPHPVAAPAPAPAFVPETAAVEAEPKKKSAMPLVAAIVGALVLAGGAAFVLMRKDSAPPPAAAAKNVAPATVAPATTAAVPLTTDTATGTLAAATQTGTALDPSLVDQEVQRRLAAERARLEAQSRGQQPAQTAAARPATPVAAAPQETAAAAPAVAPQETRPAPVPQPAAQEPAAPPQAAVASPATAAPQSSAPRVREGDLVAAGTEGLVPPRMIRRGAITYPPMARAQRAEGTVITSVLVSETGQVLDVRVIRAHSRPVGLNEAAEQAMRRSTFAPATKDGVRVRTWLTVPVEFKL